MEVDIKVGDFKLLKSGSIVFNQTNNVVFTIEDIEIEFVFKHNDTKEKGVKAVPIGNKKVQLQITNFDNVLGTAQNVPFNIASLNTGEDLFLQYAVYSINEIKILHYSWFTKPTAVEDSTQVSNIEQ